MVDVVEDAAVVRDWSAWVEAGKARQAAVEAESRAADVRADARGYVARGG
jgi:hypothetical protein